MININNEIINNILEEFINDFPYLCVEPEDKNTYKELISKAFKTGYERAVENYCKSLK